MKKREFLAVLQRSLYNLPENELKEQLSFYSEMIDDRMEEGLSEEEAVSKIGSVSDILSQIGNEKSTSLATTDRAEKKKLNAATIAIIALGSPIWLALLISLAAVIVSVGVSLAAVVFSAAVTLCAGLWTVWIVICAVEVTFVAAVACFPFLTVIYITRGLLPGAGVVFGACLFLAGAAYYLWYGCKYTLFVAVKMTKQMYFATLKIAKWSYFTTISFFKNWRNFI